MARLGDVGFWGPHVAAILARHDLPDADPVPGFNPTYPTFLCGGVVVKLFGGIPAWRTTHAGERAAHRLVATDPEIAAPRLLADGCLSQDPDAPWPYLVTTRVAGVPLRDADLSSAERRGVAAELGRQVRRIHALRPDGIRTPVDWASLDVGSAATRSSLPPHLAAQAAGYVAGLGPADPVFVHGDLCAMHAFVEDGRLRGIIDWGDAMLADRHYELIQLYRDAFDCRKPLFQAFLEAYDWPVDGDFPRRALGHALYRQAVGLVQHHTMDVFQPIAAAFPLAEIETLDALASALFD